MSAPRNTAGHAVVKNAKWLDSFANFFTALVAAFYKVPGTGPIKNILHGTWPLGHPLHPAITDITIGAYTAVVAIDLFVIVTRNTALEPAAYFVLIVAFISSLIAVLSGLTDWHDTFGEEKRTGMLHALIMIVATVFFVVSIVMRGSAGDHSIAMWASGLGWALMLIGAFFGGEMPYGYGTEVNRQAWDEHPTKWQKIEVSASSLEDRKPVVGKTKGGTGVMVTKIDGTIYAIASKCTHAGGPLNEGKWVGKERCVIECPWHASRFDVRDGTVKQGPATFPEPVFEVRTADGGGIEVRAR